MNDPRDADERALRGIIGEAPGNPFRWMRIGWWAGLIALIVGGIVTVGILAAVIKLIMD